jgi:hypothetical protein
MNEPFGTKITLPYIFLAYIYLFFSDQMQKPRKLYISLTQAMNGQHFQINHFFVISVVTSFNHSWRSKGFDIEKVMVDLYWITVRTLDFIGSLAGKRSNLRVKWEKSGWETEALYTAVYLYEKSKLFAVSFRESTSAT